VLHNGIELQKGDTITLGNATALDIWNKYSTNSLSWNVRAYTQSESWIAFENKEGTINGQGTGSIIFNIDENKLSKYVPNYADVIIATTTDNGSFQITVCATRDAREPTPKTMPVSNINSNSAKFNGTILDPGSPPYKERGFVYAKTPQPTLENKIEKLTCDVSNKVDFFKNVSNLDANTTYYVQAYAINSEGTEYGGDEICPTEILATTLSISAPTNVRASSVILNATVIDSGVPPYSERGFCYNKTDNPTISDTRKKVSNFAGNGDYTMEITQLDYQTTYHVKAYAIQNGVAVYSNNSVKFTTVLTNAEVSTISPTNITATSAKLRGYIINAGDPIYSERGFCYNKTSNPTISNKYPVDGSGEGNYELTISSLDHQTTYYVSSYVIQNGTPRYGAIEPFTTIWIETDINTYAVTNIEANSATFNGIINHMGQPECSEHGFVYSTIHTTPTTGDNKITRTGYASAYSENVTGLSSNTTYYVRAYAIQSGNPNPIYGQVQPFPTGTPPTVQTLQASDVTRINQINGTYLLFATLNGNVTNAGNPPCVERGFVYKVEDILYNTPPTYEQDIIVNVPTIGTGSYHTVTQQLSHMEWYVVRAYVKTASGAIYYGSAQTFDTWNYTEY
jgi:hypothetical protein